MVTSCMHKCLQINQGSLLVYVPHKPETLHVFPVQAVLAWWTVLVDHGGDESDGDGDDSDGDGGNSDGDN